MNQVQKGEKMPPVGGGDAPHGMHETNLVLRHGLEQRRQRHHSETYRKRRVGAHFSRASLKNRQCSFLVSKLCLPSKVFKRRAENYRKVCFQLKFS